MDDISLPLPPMATPDIRQQIVEILLEILDAHGVDGHSPHHRKLHYTAA